MVLIKVSYTVCLIVYAKLIVVLYLCVTLSVEQGWKLWVNDDPINSL